MSVKTKRQKTKQFIGVDQIIYHPRGWKKETFDKFIDDMIDLVESYGGQMGGGFCLMTEEELEEKWEMEDRSK